MPTNSAELVEQVRLLRGAVCALRSAMLCNESYGVGLKRDVESALAASTATSTRGGEARCPMPYQCGCGGER